MRKKKRQETINETNPPIIQSSSSENDLRKKLETLKSHEGLLGYIIRDSTFASMDLNDPTRTMDYAFLSSSIVNASERISRIFDLGNIKSILIEGKDIKMLVQTTSEYTISVFMEKTFDSELLKKILL